ncbi:MAG: Obg family GTPase CgtA [Planctomycetota bacterium]
MFIDSATITVRSGRGGDGAVSFLRMKYVPKGGPDGGDGGVGGDVVLVADTEVATLMDFAGRHHWKAESGRAGGPKDQHGRNGKSIEVRLPVGTLVFDATGRPAPWHVKPNHELVGEDPPEDGVSQVRHTPALDVGKTMAVGDSGGEPGSASPVIHDAANPSDTSNSAGDTSGAEGDAPLRLIVDLNTPGQRHVIARGGKGGRGNASFATPTRQVPREHTPGEPSEEYQLQLELKLVADVGLVGLPNAGKSTLLSAVSAARPRIADYPFTTLSPHPGVIDLGQGRRLVMADLPGLIRDASQGAGLGLRFLRHVERTRVLVHLLEAQPLDESDPVDNYHTIRAELARHSDVLADKPELVVLSKCDLLGDDADRHAAAEALSNRLGKPVRCISSATRWNLDALMQACWVEVERARQADPSSNAGVSPADGRAPGWGA